MNASTPADRVISAGRPDLVAYRQRIVKSTASQHGLALESALLVACSKLVATNDANVNYLSGGGTPGSQNRSRRWGEAEAAYLGALETLAAAIGVHYPKSGGGVPIPDVRALIEYRVGPLCTGWTVDGDVVHHPLDHCPRHDEMT